MQIKWKRRLRGLRYIWKKIKIKLKKEKHKYL